MLTFNKKSFTLTITLTSISSKVPPSSPYRNQEDLFCSLCAMLLALTSRAKATLPFYWPEILIKVERDWCKCLKFLMSAKINLVFLSHHCPALFYIRLPVVPFNSCSPHWYVPRISLHCWWLLIVRKSLELLGRRKSTAKPTLYCRDCTAL